MSRLNSFLRGIRVLDLSRHLPGPLTTLFMADMGAEVIKIEAPDGDELRAVGPQDSAGRSVYFQAINAGKSTRRVDLKKAEDRAEFFWTLRHPRRARAEVLASVLRGGGPAHRSRGLVRRNESGELQALFPAVVEGELPSTRNALIE